MSQQSFQAWLRERGYDQQRWSPELRRSLRARWQHEQRAKEGGPIGPSSIADASAKLKKGDVASQRDVQNCTPSLEDAAKQFDIEAQVSLADAIDEALESGEAKSSLKGTYQVGKSDIPGAEVDRWRKLRAIPQERLILDARGCSWPVRVFRA